VDDLLVFAGVAVVAFFVLRPKKKVVYANPDALAKATKYVQLARPL
jgi:hypothetical protein